VSHNLNPPLALHRLSLSSPPSSLPPPPSSETIAERVNELGAQLSVEYADKAPLVLPVMTGGFMFAADLLRAMRPSPKGMWVESIKAGP